MLERFESLFRDKPWAVFLLALAINTTALLLSHNYVDSDAHTRTYMALQWLQHPFFVYAPNNLTWVFGPLHCYLNAAVLALWNNPPLAPRILSLLLTTLTVFPLYHSVRIVFGRREAFYTALGLCFFTPFIHPAAIAASEGINLFFVFLAIWLYLRYTERFSRLDLLLSALAVLAASMMRYDSWLLTPLIMLLIFFGYSSGGDNSKKTPFGRRLVDTVAFGLVSHAFVIMWLISCWVLFRDPFYFMHYSGNLDTTEINRKLAEWGAFKMIAYNAAFLPGVMLISMPTTTFIAALIGFWRYLKSGRFNFFFWAFLAYAGFYLVTFVFSFERYPLARFTTLPAVMFFCFSGSGIVYLLDRTRGALGRYALAAFVVVTVALPVLLGFFSHPSDNPIAEKLRAVSPISNPPAYFALAADYCDTLFEQGNRLVLDCRNYNDRLLYLDLYPYFSRIDNDWPTNDSLANFIANRQPPYVLYTSTPGINHPVFSPTNPSDSATIAGRPYVLARSFGVFRVYRSATTESVAE